MELKKEYPNFVQAINQMKDTTDLTQCKSSKNVLSYGMTYVVYGNKLGDIYIDLNKHENFVYVSIATFKGLSEKAKTTGQRIYKDLDILDWKAEIASVMNMHNANPKHAQVVMDFTRNKVRSNQKTSVKNSGCMVTLLILFIPVISFFFLT